MIPPSNPERVSGPTSPAEILSAARAKIDTPDKWTTHTNARDSRGRVVSCMDKSAVCFCSSGALQSIPLNSDADLDSYGRACKFLHDAMIGGAPNPPGITWFNDHYGHAEVIARWDRAIALAEQATS